MAIKTKYTFEQLYSAYKEQYEKSELQLGESAMPKREMYSKKEFIADWAANKEANKGMSGIRVAEKLARSDVYQYSKKQSESLYKSIYSEEYEERTEIQRRISSAIEERDKAKSEEKRISIEEEIKILQKEERLLKKRQTSFQQKLRTGNLSEEEEEELESFYSDIGSYYQSLKEQGFSGKEAKEKVAKKFFSWYYV